MTTPTTVNVRLQLRADTAANWTAANPILLANEVGLETDTKKLKVGNGSSAWNSLAYFPSIVSGGTVLGNLEIGSTGTLTFEGSTADGFETTLAVTNPTADRTITLPNQSGTVVVSGNASIVDADIAANAEIAVSKLANGTANQVIVTDGTNVSWSDDLTLAGNLTVNGTTTTVNTETLVVEDKNIELGVVDTPTDTTADGGGITLKGTTDKTINWIDATDAWTSSERFSVPLGSAASPSLTFTGDENTGIYSPGADQLALSTNGTGRLFVDASGRVGVGTSPSSLLDLATTAGTDCTLRVNEGTTTNPLILKQTSTESILQTTAAHPLVIAAQDGGSSTSDIQFKTRSQERLRITSAGLVGIGTSSPAALLHLSSATGSATPTPTELRIATTSNASDWSSTDPWGRISFYSADGSNSGPKTHWAIDTTSRDVFGGLSDFQIKRNEGSGLLSTLSISALGTTTLTSGSSQEPLIVKIGTNEAARIDSSGRLLVGTSSALTNYQWFGTTYISPSLQVANEDVAKASLGLFCNNAVDTNASQLMLAKAASGTAGLVNSGETLGIIAFNGGDGTNLIRAAEITSAVDGTPGTDDMPGRLVFSTTADGASSPTERMRIDNQGRIGIGKTPDNVLTTNGIEFWNSGTQLISKASAPCLYLNRNTDDGTIVSIQQGATEEGTISISGSTVSYNGAHLSRWSQLPAGAERIEILRGTVLSNIDEMCEWGEEDNEQLNRMKVSDVEGDKNVSGVFQAWDDDDDTYTNDFYCAMTGDFIIRIGAGVTVERGDLLMSAGDGTAKPQDDDIIRSKTIAKVTSTNVSCTHPDGSYCVPCVLMAC